MGAVVLYPPERGPRNASRARPNIHGIGCVRWFAEDVYGFMDTALAGYEADTVLHWEDAPPTVELYAFSRVKPGVERDEFERRYRAHAGLARHHHPGLCRYEQAFVVRQVHGAHRPVDAIARLGFVSDDSRRTGMARDETSHDVVEADIADYLDRPNIWSVLCDVLPDTGDS